jgi:glycosyltransferase involved in cell wall biosynthesis
MSLNATIIICTRDRADSLRATLESIGRVTVPAGWVIELLIVDNGSTDHTERVSREAVLPNMQVRYLREPRRGKGYAYNSALSAAAGEILLFTDDDVRAPIDWISRMCRELVTDEADAVAGGVRLAGHLERPWLKGEVRGWVACTDDIDPQRPSRLVGANMAIARRVLERVPAFDVELGPGALGFFDETLFSQQLLEAGYRIAAALDVEVEHHPDPNRFTISGFVDVAAKLGRSSAYHFHHWRHGRVRLLYCKLLVLGLTLWLRRIAAALPGRLIDAPARGYLLNVFHFHFHAQYARERRRAPNYDYRGLRKVRGVRHFTAGCAAPRLSEEMLVQ